MLLLHVSNHYYKRGQFEIFNLLGVVTSLRGMTELMVVVVGVRVEVEMGIVLVVVVVVGVAMGLMVLIFMVFGK